MSSKISLQTKFTDGDYGSNVFLVFYAFVAKCINLFILKLCTAGVEE